MCSGAKSTKHRKTNLRQCDDIGQVYDRFMIKRDLQKIVRQNERQLISCHTTASSMHAVIISIFR